MVMSPSIWECCRTTVATIPSATSSIVTRYRRRNRSSIHAWEPDLDGAQALRRERKRLEPGQEWDVM